MQVLNDICRSEVVGNIATSVATLIFFVNPVAPLAIKQNIPRKTKS